MTPISLPETDFIVQNGTRAYIGADRRGTPRRAGKLSHFEKLLRDFGLDRRYLSDRRQANTSWLLLSDQAA